MQIHSYFAEYFRHLQAATRKLSAPWQPAFMGGIFDGR
jgi:hypothetical protein